MTSIVFACLAAGALTLSYLLPALLRRATIRKQRYEKCADLFHHKAAALLADSDTPLEIIDMISALNEILVNPGAYRVVASVVFSDQRKNGRRFKAEAREHYDAVVSPFFDRRPELAAAFSEAVVAFVSAVVYNGRGVRGAAVRLLMGDVVRILDAKKVASRIARRNHPNGDIGGHTSLHVHA